MRKFLATIALFIVMIGTFAPVSFSLNNNLTENSPLVTFKQQKVFAAIPAGGCPSGQVANTDGTDCVNVGSSNFCGSWYEFNIGCKLVTGIVEYLILPLPSFVAGIVGLTADIFLKYSIDPSVYGRCSATGCDDIANAIRSSWGIVRDFANIGFIFALFVAAFMLILDKTTVGGKQFEPKKVVVRVIMMALLVNFSLFFCRMIIQTADIFSHLLYNRMGDDTTTGITATGTQTLGSILDDLGIKSPSLQLVARVNPQTLLTGQSYSSAADLPSYLILSIASLFLYFVFIFMFAQMTFIFAGRIFALWLGMIMAPFAFVSYAIPFLEDNPYIGFENWLKNFVKLAFSVPIYLFFLYLTLSVLKINILEGVAQTKLEGVGGAVGLIISRVVPLFGAIFMLMYGKKWSVEMSGVVGEMAGKISGVVTGAAMGAVTGGAAFVGRQTLGAAGSKLAAYTADKPGLSGINTLGKGLSTSTFDVRNSKMFTKGLEYTGSATGQKMDIGSNNLQEKGGYAATGGVSQILEDRRERIADKKATEAEQEALERANNPQSRENIKKRNAERALKQTQAAKAAEEAKIAAEAEKAPINVDADKTKLEEANAKIDAEITTNNDKIADIDTKLANKKLLSDDEMEQNRIDKEAAETIAAAIVSEEKALNDKIAANAAKKIPDGMGVTQATKDQARAAIAQEKADLDAEKLRLEQKKAANQQKIDDAVAKETEQKQITDLTSEKEKLEATNVKKEEEKAINNTKMKALDNLKGKTVAQVRDEAEIMKAEAEGSKEKADLDKATKDADEEAKKVAELQEKIKKAEKEKDTKLVEELKKELNGDNWDEIDSLEETLKKTKDKAAKAKIRKEIADLTGGKQAKLNEKRSAAITAKATYENVHGKQIKALEDVAKDAEKAYKGTDENKARVAVFTKRENELKVDVVKATIEVNNMRKKILGAHADALNNVGKKVDGHPLYSAPVNAGKAVVGAVAPILGVITNGRVGAGYVNNNSAFNTAANNIRTNARTGGSTPPKQ